jgi:hypothetical protein
MGRSSFAKRDRDRAKKAKADAKRERRQGGVDAPEDEAGDAPEAVEDDDTPVEELLAMIEEVHRLHDDGQISDQDFEETKTRLLARLTVD